jgi:hypothetical protein
MRDCRQTSQPPSDGRVERRLSSRTSKSLSKCSSKPWRRPTQVRQPYANKNREKRHSRVARKRQQKTQKQKQKKKDDVSFPSHYLYPLPDSELSKTITNHNYGTITDYVHCQKCNNQRLREDRFLSLTLPVLNYLRRPLLPLSAYSHIYQNGVQLCDAFTEWVRTCSL